MSVNIIFTTLPGLGITETKVLVYIVKEFSRINALKSDSVASKVQDLATNHVTKHIGKPHSETMKIINRLRSYGHVRLVERQSAGYYGNGYDGQLYGALIPTESAMKLVTQYFSLS